MGRVKKYSKQHSNKHKNLARKAAAEKNDDAEMIDQSVLPIAKRKQIFKKKDRREVKKQIRELRLDSLKLKKKVLDQKSEKKQIAQKIKQLKIQLKNDGSEVNLEDE